MIMRSMGASVCGHPADSFDLALAWQPIENLKRRGFSQKGVSFPSWSWAGWVGRVRYPFMSGPKELEICPIIDWTFWAWMSTSKEPNGKHEMSCYLPGLRLDVESVGQFGEETRWIAASEEATPRGLYSWCGRELEWCPNLNAYWLHERSYWGSESGLLVFHTESVVCSVNESSAYSPADYRDLHFLSVLSNDTYIGELKVDSNTIQSLLKTEDEDGSNSSVELIQLFELDFATSSLKSLLFLNRMSRLGQFRKEFVDMIEGSDDKHVYVVMWIRWENGVAYIELPWDMSLLRDSKPQYQSHARLFLAECLEISIHLNTLLGPALMRTSPRSPRKATGISNDNLLD
jgi:hypothetical protein